METRSAWGSRFGFIMTTAGFAVGLGAIWRFPYMISKNGGAFLLVYVITALIIGIPLFISETMLGQETLALPGAFEGVRWFLSPDFSAIDCGVLLDALCHTFFAIGIGVFTAFVYGSYLDRERSGIPVDAVLIMAINTGIAILAGLVIFPAMASFGLKNGQSTGLLFETMPLIFAGMEGGAFSGLHVFLSDCGFGFCLGCGAD